MSMISDKYDTNLADKCIGTWHELEQNRQRSNEVGIDEIEKCPKTESNLETKERH